MDFGAFMDDRGHFRARSNPERSKIHGCSRRDPDRADHQGTKARRADPFSCVPMSTGFPAHPLAEPGLNCQGFRCDPIAFFCSSAPICVHLRYKMSDLNWFR